MKRILKELTMKSRLALLLLLIVTPNLVRAGEFRAGAAVGDIVTPEFDGPARVVYIGHGHGQDEWLIAFDRDLKELLISWFDIGFLSIERITWQSPAALLEKRGARRLAAGRGAPARGEDGAPRCCPVPHLALRLLQG